MITKQELIDFEIEIKELFLDKKILSPVHLCGGNEDALIEIFKHIHSEDFVCSTHRSHYHALLKGIPKEWLRNEILSNRSIHISNKDYNFLSSAIVAGNLPIALGIALGIKRSGGKNRVYVFSGDMASETGMFHECTKYAEGFQLPITFIVEDNGYSTDAPTGKVWGRNYIQCTSIDRMLTDDGSKIIVYSYNRTYPHVGCGQWVQF